MANTQTIPTTLAATLNKLEQEYFFRRCNKEASSKNYIDSNTWRGFHSLPKTPYVPSDALRSAFDFLSKRLEAFLQKTPNITRAGFDAFHKNEVEALYEFLCTYRSGIVVQPRSTGGFHGFAYGSYCKVLNLAHTHWCFRRRPNKRDVHYPPAAHPELCNCIHVPLDSKVLGGVEALIAVGELPYFSIPRGGMGCVKSYSEYIAIQNYLRTEADTIKSTNFLGSTLSPLAFEGFYTP